MSTCIHCGLDIPSESIKRKFCSTRCKNKFYQANSYQKQQERGRKRKIDLIKLKGERCQSCGYITNYSALCFHHSDPKTKKFGLDLRSLSNRSWKVILAEAEKCQLLCLNCHNEHHYPECVSENT